MKNKLNINGKQYTFKMTNRSVIKMDEKYGRASEVINSVIRDENFYSNAAKLLTCTCNEKEWDYEELLDELEGEQFITDGPDVANNILIEYLAVKKKNDDKEKN